jgi:signal transduction histidine kinase
MMSDMELHLKRARGLTGAAWAAVVALRRGHPLVQVGSGLSKAAGSRLEEYLGKIEQRSGRARIGARKTESSVRVPESANLGAARLLFLPTGGDAVLVVGADQLSRPSRQIWRLVAGMMQDRRPGTGRRRTVPRAEDEGHRRQLTLVRDVLERLMEVSDDGQVSEIVAEQAANALEGHHIAVVLGSQEPAAMSFGFGGPWTPREKQAFAENGRLLRDDMLSRALRAGVPTLPGDAGSGGSRGAFPGNWATAMCIPVRHPDATLGAVFVSSGREDALGQSEILAVESIAAALSAVVSNLAQQRRLEETIEQLRAAQLESGTRLAAQQQAESRLVHAAKLVAVGEMAAGVAHELNNPLTTITGFAELILDDTPTNAKYRADVEMVLREARRARGVVRRLLDFSRQGQQARARVDINEVVEDALALMTHFIHTSGVQLELDLVSGLPWITVDSNQMKQVLLNLVHNALNAMPGGGRLQIRTTMRSKDQRTWLVIQIADDGVGIEESELGRIFEPFYTTRGDSGGTGLGLSVTYGLVADHGGTIYVESKRGSGSVFSVWLPA